MCEFLPTPLSIKRKYNLSLKNKSFIASSREKAKDFFLKKRPRKIVFVGPCSVHNEKEIVSYGKKLKKLSLEIESNFFIVMRFYYEKPRSSKGWKGFVYDPDLNGRNDIIKGIKSTRKLLLTLTDMEIPIATEILDPFTYNYFSDLITWGFIGSRTSSSQIHRQLASSFDFPVGLKNGTDGDIQTSINNVEATRASHSFIHLSDMGLTQKFHSKGNIFSHITLRGTNKGENYHLSDINELYSKMKENNLHSPIVIDCAHANSQKNIDKQMKCFEESFNLSLLDKNILGFMLESYLNEGMQEIPSDISHLKQGISITDPCLSFEQTEKLLLRAHQSLSTSISSVQN